MEKIRDNKNNKAFGMFLCRKKIECGYAIATLLIEKFAFAKKPSDWQAIFIDDLKTKGILPSNKYNSYAHWREEMIKNRLLVCMATKEEISDNLPNHKASMFKFTGKVQKYIENAIKENLPHKVEEIDDRMSKLEEKVITLEENQEHMIEFLLEAFPPDTPKRRELLLANIKNKEVCKKLLKENKMEIDKNNEAYYN